MIPGRAALILERLHALDLLGAQRAYEALLVAGPTPEEAHALRAAGAWDDDLAEEQVEVDSWLRHDHLAAHAFARRLWGQVLPEQGPEAALALLDAALQQGDQPVLRFQRARLLQDLGRDNEAAPLLAELEARLDLLDADGERDYWNRRCYLALDGEDRAEALRVAQAFAARFPDDALAGLHETLARAPELDDAALTARLLALAERFPDDPAPLGTLADQLRLRGRLDEALAMARRGLQRDAGHRVSLSVITRVLLTRGDGAGALPYARALHRLNPSSEEAWRWLAVALQLARRTDEALDVNRVLLERFGERPQDVLRHVGMLLAKGGSAENRHWAERLVLLSPTSSVAWVMAGLARWQTDALDEAAEALRRALACTPLDPRAELLREKLREEGVEV